MKTSKGSTTANNARKAWLTKLSTCFSEFFELAAMYGPSAPAQKTAPIALPDRKARGRPPSNGKTTGKPTTSDGILMKVVRAGNAGITTEELRKAWPKVRPNHLGIMLKRHINAGRVKVRAGTYYPAIKAAQQPSP